MKDEKYQYHAMTLVKDVIPESDINYLINLFMVDASINMGSDFTEQTLERTIFIVKFEFKYLPMAFIASAFNQGSMGKYGVGRLVPRTISGWLNEVSIEYRRLQYHEAIKKPDYLDSLNLHKFPAGKAIIKKINWDKSGAINTEDWDKIPLMELADMIGRGTHPELHHFFLKDRRKLL